MAHHAPDDARTEDQPTEDRARRFGRRQMLKVGGLGAGAVAMSALVPIRGSITEPLTGLAATTSSSRVAFFGPHQAGILTPPPQHLTLAAIDLGVTKVDELRSLLKEWTKAAAAMTIGDPIGALTTPATSVPADSGEVVDETAANLTITVGFGPSMFDRRFGFGPARPAPLADLPRFSKDQLDPRRSGGDILVQACSDSPQVSDHAIRDLLLLAGLRARFRWMQRGFADVPGAPGSTGTTPRNALGFRDGTSNLDVNDAARMTRNVWANTAESPNWMAGGTYAVVRRVRNLIEVWDRATLEEQENTIGRRKYSGAPFGRTGENDEVDSELLPITSHVRVANPRTGQASEDERILRRGYNYADGLAPITGPIPDDAGKPQTGLLDAGLMFIAFQRDPRKQFVPMQTRLDANDALNEYLVHTGSGVYAILPGVRDTNDWWGRSLLERR